MHIDWWTLGLQTINLLVLLWLLGRFLFRPLANIIAQRQAETEKLLDEAKEAQNRAQAAERAAKDEQARTISMRSTVLEQAGKEAEAQRAALLETARKEAAAQQIAATGVIAQERAKAKEQLEKEASLLATDIAAQLLNRSSSDLPLNIFLPQLGKALAALPEMTRKEIGGSGETVSLTSAQPLDDAAQAEVTAAITQALGRTVTLKFHDNPALIAGLCLSTDMVQVNASFREELDHIREELAHHDN